MLPSHRLPQNPGLVAPPAPPRGSIFPVPPPEIKTVNTNPGEGSNTQHVERPKFNERRRFSSYGEYKTIRNRPVGDRLFEGRVKQSFATGVIEMLGVDESGGYVGGIGNGREVDDGLGSREEGGAKEMDVVGQEERQSCRSKSVIRL